MSEDLLLQGSVRQDEADCARTMIGAVLVRHHLTDRVRVRLTVAPGRSGPVVVQVNLRLFGAPARVQVAARTAAEAIAAVVVRLDRQIKRLSGAWEPWPWPDPERLALSEPGGAAITRRKTVALGPRRSCQAGSFLAAMDYDVSLFADADTGEDAVVYRAGPTGLRIARQRSMRPPAPTGTPALTVNPRPTPVLTPPAAAQRLAEGWLPFLFFTAAGTGRGNLVYRRYDGGIGLMVPRPAEPACHSVRILGRPSKTT